jgi:hypothetical protein
MKIGLHANQLDFRGNSTVTFDYASALRDILGHEPLIISSRVKSTHPTERFSMFGVKLYEDPKEIPNIIEQEKIDVLYMTKAGNNDKITPDNCKTAIHCVFDMREPHGDVYAGVSEWLAKFYGKDLWVPHIINPPKNVSSLHEDLGIPKSDFVIGRLGGYEQFDLEFVHTSIIKVIESRKDLWAIFLNTKPFANHPRIKFLPFNPDGSYKWKFINTCDAMIHGRSDGETFGLAVGEFSAMNKPVFTYDAPYWWYMKSHLHILGEKAIVYKNEEDLTVYLKDIDKEYVKDVDWDCYSTRFSSNNVIKKFDEVFLK